MRMWHKIEICHLDFQGEVVGGRGSVGGPNHKISFRRSFEPRNILCKNFEVLKGKNQSVEVAIFCVVLKDGACSISQQEKK